MDTAAPPYRGWYGPPRHRIIQPSTKKGLEQNLTGDSIACEFCWDCLRNLSFLLFFPNTTTWIQIRSRMWHSSSKCYLNKKKQFNKFVRLRKGSLFHFIKGLVTRNMKKCIYYVIYNTSLNTIFFVNTPSWPSKWPCMHLRLSMNSLVSLGTLDRDRAT